MAFIIPGRTSRVRAVVAVSALVLAAAARAKAATPAEAFVSTSAAAGIAILQDRRLSAGERRARFGAFLTSVLDFQRIALFTLGPAGAGARQGDIDAYSDAFRDFTLATYQSRMSDCDGRTLRVTGSTVPAPGTAVVSAKIVGASPTGPAPGAVDLRLVEDGGRFRLVDASIGGVWLMDAARNDCQGRLRQHGGNIGVLTERLNDMTHAIQFAGR
jgi:phospholipid transport system substrate-binding protein